MRPSVEYAKLYRQLDIELARCIEISRKHSGKRSPTGSHFYASAIFTLLITRTASFRKILPKPRPKTLFDSHWDFGSACTLTRSILETRLAFYYLGSEPCPQDEWTCRWSIFCLHDDASRRRVFDALSLSQISSEEKVEYEEMMDHHRAELKTNSFFTALPPGDQRRFLQGKQAYLYPLETIASNCGLEVEHFRFFYSLMSQHAHALPAAYFRMDERDRGRGVHSELEERYHQMCIGLVIALIAGAANEMEAKFSDSEA
jgi:hypothetical protein